MVKAIEQRIAEIIEEHNNRQSSRGLPSIVPFGGWTWDEPLTREAILTATYRSDASIVAFAQVLDLIEATPTNECLTSSSEFVREYKKQSLKVG